MRKLRTVLVVVLAFGCAKVSVETPEPIKVDISMRIDVYQHVVEDVDSVESQIYGERNETSRASFFMGVAYAAASDFPEEVTAAIERRKARIGTVAEYFQKGYLGENKEADLEGIASDIPVELQTAVRNTIAEENKDRQIVYEAIAEKNDAPVAEVRKVFLQNHYQRAPQGYFFEIYSEEQDAYIWIQK